jgi:N-acetylglucosamine kinase-like BadF-type ATPase
MRYYLGADVGSSKTALMVADEDGNVLGYGVAGPGNHETVGFDGFYQALDDAVQAALGQAGIPIQVIAGAGYGISGYDWPSQKQPLTEAIARLGCQAPSELVNDAILGLVAGAEAGWGIAVVSGSGCNCWGWDQDHRIGRVTGFGGLLGEGAGSTELVYRAMQLVARAWTQRGRSTRLTDILVEYSKASDVEDLLAGYTSGSIRVDGSAAPLIFAAAEAGDDVAQGLVHWAGCELGELANAVIRQLELQDKAFDVVLVGGMFASGPPLIDPLRATIQSYAPRARLLPLSVPPVVGAVLLGMQAAGISLSQDIRRNLAGTIPASHGDEGP